MRSVCFKFVIKFNLKSRFYSQLEWKSQKLQSSIVIQSKCIQFLQSCNASRFLAKKKVSRHILQLRAGGKLIRKSVNYKLQFHCAFHAKMRYQAFWTSLLSFCSMKTLIELWKSQNVTHEKIFNWLFHRKVAFKINSQFSATTRISENQ